MKATSGTQYQPWSTWPPLFAVRRKWRARHGTAYRSLIGMALGIPFAVTCVRSPRAWKTYNSGRQAMLYPIRGAFKLPSSCPQDDEEEPEDGDFEEDVIHAADDCEACYGGVSSVDVDLLQVGSTPLFMAAFFGHSAVVPKLVLSGTQKIKELCRSRADVNHVASEAIGPSRTALHMATVSQLRRQRSLARYQLWAWKQGQLSLSDKQVRSALARLRAHHSWDPGLLTLARRRTRRIISTVDMEDQSWFCDYCGLWRKAGSKFCGECGWQNPTMKRPAKKHQAQQWNYAQNYWQEDPWYQRAPSQNPKPPREVSQTSQPKPKKKAKSPRRPHKPKKTDQPPPEPRWDTGTPAGSADAAPSDKAAPSQPPPTDPQMQKLLVALQRHDVASNLSQEVQGLLRDVTQQNVKTEVQQMHDAVNSLAKAKKALQGCKDARLALHTTWRKHVADSLLRWRKYLEEFKEKDRKLEEDNQQALQALREAKAALNVKKAAAASADDEALEVDDDEDEILAPAIAAQVRQGIDNMASNFAVLQKEADEALEELRKPKRPRTDPIGACQAPSGRIVPVPVTDWPTTSIWNHSICLSSDYKSEWQALEEATALAWELGHPIPHPAPTRPRFSPRQPRRVQFLDDVQLRFVNDFADFGQIVVPHHFLQNHHQKYQKLEHSVFPDSLAEPSLWVEDCVPTFAQTTLQSSLSMTSSTLRRSSSSSWSPTWCTTWTSTALGDVTPLTRQLRIEPHGVDDIVTFMQMEQQRRDASRSRERRLPPRSTDPTASSSTRPAMPDDATTWELFFVGQEWYECDIPTSLSSPPLHLIAVCSDEDIGGLADVAPVDSSVFELPLWVKPAVVIRRGNLMDHPGSIFALIDIVFHRNRQDPADRIFPQLHRSTRPLPALLRRGEILDYIRLTDTCADGDTCQVYLNDALLPRDDMEIHGLAHGSYILIHVAPPNQGRHGQAAHDWLLDEGASVCTSLAAFDDPAIDTEDSGQPASDDQQPNDSSELEDFGTNQSGGSPRPHGHLRVRSWYISHLRLRRCDSSRIVTLSQDPRSWLRTIQAVWQEHFDATQPFALRLVPQSTPLLLEQTEPIPHLIVEQDFQPEVCAILVSALNAPGASGFDDQQFATSNSAVTNRRALLQHLLPRIRAGEQQGHVYVDGGLLLPSSLLRMHSGQSVEVAEWQPARLPTDPDVAPVTPMHRQPQQQGTPEHVRDILTRHNTEAAAGALRMDQAFVTWFLHGTTDRTCWTSRILPLENTNDQWEEDLRRLWQDKIEADLPLDLFFVRPSPPHNIGLPPAGHIILAQALPFDHKALLFSQIFDDGPWLHHAFIGKAVINKVDAIAEGDAIDPCIQRHLGFHCLVRFSGIHLTWTTTLALENGANLVFEVATRDRPPYPLTPLDIGRGPTVFWPEEGSDELEDLLPAYRALPPEELPRGLLVTTWYLHHEDQLRCYEPRFAALGADRSGWETSIATVWQDKLRRGSPCHFHIVQPQPLDTGRRPTTLHVILSQSDHVHPERRAIIISSSFAWEQWNIAVSALAGAIPETLIWYTDNFDKCSPARDGWDCHVYHGDRELHPGQRIAMRHGMQFLVTGTLREVGPQPDHEPVPDDSLHGSDDDDSSSFLQRTSCFARQGKERQRAGPVAHAQPPLPPTEQRRKLCLDELPPSASTTTTPFHEVVDLYERLLALPLPLLRHWPGSIDWTTPHGTTWQALPAWTGDIPHHFAFYTDGSRKAGNVTGSGVALLVSTANGFQAGGMIASRGPNGWAGEAEHHALCWALLWAIQLGRWHTQTGSPLWPTFSFHYDATITGNLAGGEWSSTANKSWHTLLRSLAQLLTAAFGGCRVEWNHVYAHQGHALNELVDELAKYAADMPFQPNPVLDWVASSHSLLLFQWLWLLVPATHQHPSFPQLIDGHLHHTQAERPQLPPVSSDPEIPTATPPKTGSLKIASANVLTLDDRMRGESLHPGSRQQLLMRQFSQQRFHVVALQETRHRREVLAHSPEFAVVGHPADPQGHGGIQLWLNTRCPLGPGMRPWQLNDCSIVEASAEWMICKLRHPALRFVLVIAHGPHAEHGYEACAAFWTCIHQCLRAKCRHWKVIFAGDANAHLGSVVSEAVYDHQAEEENAAGETFHEWLLNTGLWLPSTCGQCQHGPGGTFLHPRDQQWRRLDYIGVDQSLPITDVKSWVAESIDISTKRIDHLAIGCQFSFESQDWPVFFAAVRAFPTWGALVNRAFHRSVMQEAIAHNTIKLHEDIFATLQDYGVQWDHPCDHAPAPLPTDVLPCPHCDQVFLTRQHLGVHLFHAHGIHSVESGYAQTSVCPGCLKDFRTTFRLVQHLKYRGNGCFDKLDGVRPPEPRQHVDLPDALQHVKRLPCVRKHHGPLRPSPVERRLSGLRTDLFWLRFEEASMAPLPTDGSQAALIADFEVKCRPLLDASHHLGSLTLVQWVDFFVDIILDFYAAHGPCIERVCLLWLGEQLERSPPAEVRDRLHAIVDGWAVDLPLWTLRSRIAVLELELATPSHDLPRPPAAAVQPRSTVRDGFLLAFDHLQQWEVDRRERSIFFWPSPSQTLLPDFQVFVHLYSGRRRYGDVHQWLEEHTKHAAGSCVILSLDTAVDLLCGDFSVKWRSRGASQRSFSAHHARHGQHDIGPGLDSSGL
eukprot:Skav210304  [mRNA]  locus=scaffold475:173180:186348:- [translate_table: standard]